MKASLGEELVAALVKSGDPAEFVRLAGVEQMLKVHEREAYDKVKQHVRRHGVLPASATARDEYGLHLPDVEEPPSYYHDRLVERHVKLGITQAVRDVNDRMRAKPLEALAHLRRACFELSRSASPTDIVDFRDAADVVIPRYVSRFRAGGEDGVRFGWPFLDSMSGGVAGGDLVSFVGRPAQGKTQMLLWAAMNAWRSGLPVLFVSMEMKPELIVERGAGIQTSTPLDEIRQVKGRAIPDTQWRGFKKGLVELREKQVPLWVVDGKLTATVDEVHMLVSQMRPAAVYVDGAYLLQHPNDRLQRHERIARNCDLLKGQVATDLNVPVTCTWQFNREGSKRKGKEPGLEDIAGSDAIGQHSSLVLALLEDDEDLDPATLLRREVRIIKGRQGEVGRFEVRWDWERMDFGEYEEPEVGSFYGT